MYGWRGFLGRILDPFTTTTVLRRRGGRARVSTHVSSSLDPTRGSHDSSAVPDVDHMVWMLDEVLEQARLRGQDAQTEPVEVRVLLTRIMRRYDPDRVLLAPAPWPLFVAAKPIVLEHIFEILLDVAVANSTRTTIRLDRGTSAMVAHVDDNGPGIPRSAREILLAGAEPCEDRRGTLARARLIARAMHGDVTISSSPEGGARLTVRLPILPDGTVEYAAAS